MWARQTHDDARHHCTCMERRSRRCTEWRRCRRGRCRWCGRGRRMMMLATIALARRGGFALEEGDKLKQTRPLIISTTPLVINKSGSKNLVVFSICNIIIKRKEIAERMAEAVVSWSILCAAPLLLSRVCPCVATPVWSCTTLAASACMVCSRARSSDGDAPRHG